MVGWGFFFLKSCCVWGFLGVFVLFFWVLVFCLAGLFVWVFFNKKDEHFGQTKNSFLYTSAVTKQVFTAIVHS